jgi:hypothetical protein
MAGSPDILAPDGGNVKSALVRRVIWGLVALVLAGVGVGAKLWMDKNAKSGEPVAASVQAAPRPQAPAASAAPAAAPAPARAEAAPNAKPGTGAKAVPPPRADAPATVRPGTPATAASGEGAGAPVVTGVAQPSQALGSGLAHLDDHLTYQYNALGRRDPFQSLVDGEFVGADVGGDAPPDPGGIKVVGIVWGSTDQFALVEDVRGNSFVLRKGDKVQNGFVEGLKRDALVVTITAEGQSQSVVIPLERKGDQNAR